MADKQVMLIAIDDSEHSNYALVWTLDHFFKSGSSSNFRLIVVHAKTPVLIGFAGPGTGEILTLLEAESKRNAERVIAQAKGICKEKSVSDVEFEVVEGDARNVMCNAVEKHNASILVVGSHGYGAIKRAVLGSVSDYCAHHARCSVMIVKRPKPKH